MLDKALDRVGRGGKTIEGKIIAVLLTLSLSLMAWSPFTIKTAFAGDDGGADGISTEVINDKGVDGAAVEAGDAQDADLAAGDPQGEGDEVAVVDEDADGDEAAEGEEAESDAVLDETDSDADIEAAEGEAVEPEADEAVEPVAEDLYPAQSFNDNANGITVDVKAPAGALPAGAKMVVSPVSSDAIEGAVADALPTGTVAKSITAVDITFYDAEGNEVEPLIPISVTMRAWSMMVADDPVVVHVDNQGAGTVVTDKKATTTTMEFDSKDFSVYAVVETVTPRLTVTFKSGSTTIETMYVKAADTASEVEAIIFDPGAGSVPGGQVFKGWTIAAADGTYPTDGEGGYELMSIAQVRADAMERAAALNGEDDEITYTAALFKQYKVDYVDREGISLGSATVEIPNYETEGAYTVNMYYATDDTHNLEGWQVLDSTSQGNIKDYPQGAITEEIEGEMVTYYPNGTDIVITGDVTFAVEAPEGFWLVFDENGKGATYNAPRFIKAGEHTVQPTIEMVRNGYTFGGWYKDAACTDGQEFTFGGTLTGPTTVYAKWIPMTTANYTVIIWKQNVSGDGYDFVESVSASGAVGSTPTAVNANNGRVSGATYNGETGFSFKSTDQASQTIAPEGNTVVNVYWDRNQYTLQFQAQTYTYTPTTSNNGTQYGLVDGQYVQLTRHGNLITGYYWTYGNNIRYNGTRYTRSNNQTWQTIKTITALYQQNIGENFPIEGSNGVTYNNGERWQPQNSSTFNQVLVYIDVMPAENVTFRVNTSTNPTKHIHYYVEALPDETPTRTYNGMGFVEYTSVDANYGFFTQAEDYINLVGFSKSNAYPPEAFDANGNRVNTVWNNGNAIDVYCYYTRDTETLNFMDGAYYDGNGARITAEASRGQLSTVGNLSYGADLTSYNAGGDDYFAPEYAGYVFEGWYLDDACTQAYTFTTMPEGGMTVYAKWRQIQYRVFLHPNAGTDSTLYWGSDSQEMNFRVSYGGKVSVPEGTRTGYEWFGWYTDEAGTQPFTDATALNEQTVTADYDKTDPANYTENMDQWGNNATSNGDTDRFWITKKLDLYGKWSAVIVGAEGIGVIYDANGGSSAPTDSALYKDAANVSVGYASKAPAGQVFSHWVLQTWNGSAYADTTTTLLPGQSFAISKDDAKITITGTETIVAPEDVTADGHYTYTIQLKAVYKDVEEETPTHIYWYDNYNSDNDGKGVRLQANEDIKINEAVDICAAPTREGYTFKGWTKTQGGTDADFLVWDGSKYTTTINGDSYDVTQVAADEKDPVEDVYAVWAPIEYTVIFDKNAEDATGEMANETFAYNEEKALTANAFEREHYTFLGWNTAADGSGMDYDDAQIVKNLANTDGAEITLYAQWEVIQYNYTIHHYLKGTTTQVADDVTGKADYGSTITAEPVTTYQSKDLTVDSYNPSQAITITDSADGNVITIYYTLPLEITAKTDSKTYDGTPLDGAYTVTGALDSDTAAIEAALGTAPSITNVSESPKNYLTDDEQAAITGIPSYYVVEYTPGTLTITPAPMAITINGSSDSKVYNGETQTYEGTVTPTSETIGFDASKFSYAGSTTASGKDVGDYPTPIDITAAAYDDTNYVVTYTAGDPVKLTITPAEITITADDKTKVYDNDASTDPALTATVTGVPAAGVAPVYSLSRVAGQDAGTYTITVTAAATDNPNYTIAVEDGTFTIAPASVTVYIEGDTSETDMYNGTGCISGSDDSDRKWEIVRIDPENSTFQASYVKQIGTREASGLDVGQYNYGFTASDFGLTDAAADNYVVTFEVTDGYFTITKAPLTITVKDQIYTYNGEPQGEDNVSYFDVDDVTDVTDKVTVVGLEGGDKLTGITLNGVQTNAGVYSEEIVASVDSANFGQSGHGDGVNVLDNYDVTYVNGTLTIKKKAVEITINGSSDSETYTGSPLTSDTKVTPSSEDALFDAEKFSYSGASTITETDAGTYTEPIDITKAAYADANLDVTFVAGTPVSFTINKKAVTVTVNGSSDTKVYNGSAQTSVTDVTASSEDALFDASKFSYSGAKTITETNVGEYSEAIDTEAASYADDNLDVTFKAGTPVTFEITKAEIAVTLDGNADTKVYNGLDQTFEGAVTPTSESSLFDAEKFSYSGETSVTGKNVGEYSTAIDTTKASYADDNLTVTFTAGTPVKLTITKAEIAVTLNGNADTKVYNGLDQTFEGAVTPTSESSLFDAAKVTYAGETSVTGKNVGEYSTAIDTTKASYADDNLTVTFTAGAPVKLTITRAEVTITAKDATKVYDGIALRESGFTVAGLADTDTHTFTVGMTTDSAITDVGTKTNVVALVDGVAVDTTEPTEVGNYLVTVVNGTLTVNPAAITITADNKSKVFDNNASTDPALTATVTGVPAEGVAPTYSLSREEGQDVGEYPINVTAEADSNPNYTITVQGGTFTITKAKVTVTLTGLTSTVTYTGAEQTFGNYQVSINDPTHTSTHGIYTLANPMPKATGTDVGTYRMGLDETCISASETAGNYDITFEVVDGSLTIDKAPLTITAVQQTYTYNGEPQGPAGTYTTGIDAYVTATGLVGGDTLSSITLAGTGTDVGTYTGEIVPSAAAVAFNHTTDKTITDNYTVTYVNGDLTITPAEMAVEAIGYEGKYDGQAHSAGATPTVTEGTTVTYSIDDGATWSETAPSITNAGTVEFIVKATNPNYEDATATGTLVVTPRDVTLTSGDGYKTYDAQDLTNHDVTVSGDGFVEGEGASYNVTGKRRLVGTATNTFTYTLNEGTLAQNYNITKVEGTLTVDYRDITLTANDDTKIYDGTPLTRGGCHISGMADSDPTWYFAIEMTADSTITDVGSVPNVIAKVEGVDVTPGVPTIVGNYRVTTANGTLTVTKRPLTVTATSDTKVYDGELIWGEYTLGEGQLVEGHKIGRIVHNGDGPDVGTYDHVISVVEVSDASDNDVTGNYEITLVDGTFTITPAAITITADDKTKVYDNKPSTDPELTATVTGKSTAGVAPVYSLSRVEGQDVGAYAITVTAEAASNPNYTVTVAGGTFTITPAEITITAKDATKVYDGDPLLQSGFDVEGMPEGDSHTFRVNMTSASTITDVGTQPNEIASVDGMAVGSGKAWEVGNYLVTVVDGTLEVTPAKITIKADDKTKVYDNDPATDPALTATVTGVPEMGTAPVYSLSRAEGQDVGDYAITVTAEAASNPNYTVAVEGGTFTITRATMTVNATNYNGVYDGQAHEGGAAPSVTEGTTVQYSIDNGQTWTDTVPSITNVGTVTYQVKATNPNYEDATATGTLTVAKRPLTVTASTDTKVYDGEELYGSYTLGGSGLVEGHKIGRIRDNWAGPEAGTEDHVITVVEVSDAMDNDVTGNYEITLVKGTYTITPAAITIKADNRIKAYDNDPSTDPELTATVTGVPEKGVAPVYSLSREEGQDVGEYAITVTAEEASNPNYTVTVEGGTFKITPVEITIAADDLSKAYDNDASTDPALTATVTGVPEKGVAPVYSLSREEGQDVGEYAITVTAEATSNPNYTVTVEGGTFKITPVAITIKADDKTKAYDNDASTDPALTATVTGVPANGTAPAYSLSRVAGQDVGTYAITVTAVEAENPNYTVTVEGGTFTITAVAITIKADGKTKVYDNNPETDPALTATVTGVPEKGTAPAYSLSREPGQAVGEYAITVTAEAADNPNYTVTVEGGTFTITKRQITISAVTETVEYNGDSQTANYKVTGTFGEGDRLFSITNSSPTDAGEYDVIPRSARIVNGQDDVTANYDIIYVGGTLTITKAPLTITAKPQTYTYNGEEQGLSGNNYTSDFDTYVEVTGLKNRDQLISINLAGKKTDVGVYEETIVPSNGRVRYIEWSDAVHITDNYDVTYVSGTLTITPLAITITADDKTKPYDNDASTDPALTATVTGVPENGAAPVYTVTRAEGQDVGEYAITVTAEAASNPNYTITVAGGTFEITPVEITIAADDLSKVYGEDDPDLTATVTGKPAAGADVNYTVSREQGEAVGEYTITVTLGENPNYTVSKTDGTFTIEPADITDTERFTVTGPEDATYNADEQKQPVTITDKVTGKELVEGTDFTIAYTDADGGDDLTNAGTKTVTITGKGNYEGTLNETYDITPAPLTVTVADQTKKLGEDDPEFTGTVEGLQGDDTEESFGITYSREEGEDAGEYAITASYTENPNYEVTVKDGKLVIEPIVYHITFNPNGGTLFGSPEIYTMDVEVTTMEGTDITIVEAAVRDGYTFLYWRGSEYQPGDTYTVTVETGDHAFTAEWEKNAQEPVLPKTGDDRGTLAGMMGATSLLALFALVFARRRMREDEEVVA